MKLADARGAYYEASGTASSIARQLALTAVAIIWLLAGGLSKDSRIHLSLLLLWASLAVIGAIFFDLMQYLWAGTAYAVWARRSEERLDRDGLLRRPEPPPPAPAVPRLARMLNYPPIPPAPLPEPEGNEREIGETPRRILAVQWWLFAIKIACTITSFALIAVSLVHRIAVS